MATSENKGSGELAKNRPQSQASDPAAKATAAFAGSQRGETEAGRRTGPTELPSQFGRYRVVKRLGGGGMGTVYLVENTDLEREEALKVPHFADGDDAQVRERFLREARSAAKLDHANLCPVYDAGVQDGIYYMTMRFLKGKLLSDYTGTAQPPRKAVEIVTRLAQALEAAHARGVIHRDLKPSNVMMVSGVGPVVMDFGLSKQFRLADQNLTQPGSTLGTPAYMPPEQVNGDLEQMGPASDVYSLGVILYQLLTGRLPFEGSMAAIFGQILYSEAPLPSALVPGLSPELDTICQTAMAKAATGRYPSMKAFAAALTAYLRSTSPTEGAGNLVPTVVGKPDIFQAATVAPPARSSLPPKPRGAQGPSTSRKPDSSHQATVLAARRADDDEGGARGESSFGTILVRGVVLVAIVGGGWLTYSVMQKSDQKSEPVAEANLPASSKVADSKQPVAEATVPPSRTEPDPQQVAVKAAAPPPVTQAAKKDEIKYDMELFEKEFGLKVNSVKLQPETTTDDTGDTQITLTLEFMRTLIRPTFSIGAEDLAVIKDAFAGKATQWIGSRERYPVVLRCFFFDEDGVVFMKQPPGKIQGEVTGKKGDAFRITQTVPNAVLAKTTKISFRKDLQAGGESDTSNFPKIDGLPVAEKPAEPTPDHQEGKQDEIKYDMDYLEKGFGMKLNAVKLQPVKTKGDTQITLTLEFTKNLDVGGFLGPSNKEIVQNAFAGKPWEDLFGGGNRGSARVVLRCFFFDEDGVVFMKQPPGKIQGEVTGKKGDAFRITQTVPNAVLAKTTKISFRKEVPEQK